MREQKRKQKLRTATTSSQTDSSRALSREINESARTNHQDENDAERQHGRVHIERHKCVRRTGQQVDVDILSDTVVRARGGKRNTGLADRPGNFGGS
jgi:hypothetical protein